MAFNILDSIPDTKDFKSYTDRYFSKRYVLEVDGVKNNDIMIMFHSNRIAILSLAPSHYFFKKNEEYKINFSVGNVNRLSNVVKGKGKKGGQSLTPKSVVCKIEYNDGTSFDIPACMKGTLIEVNEELVNNPTLLKKQPDSDGFIAIILSSIAVSETTKSALLSHDDYLNTINGVEAKQLEDAELK